MLRALSLAIAVCGLVILPGRMPAAESSVPRIVGGSGDVALRKTASDAWDAVGNGDQLPPECHLAISGSGPKTIRLSGGTLHLDANCRARLNAEKSEIRLQCGRVYLVVEEGQAWQFLDSGLKTPLKVAGPAGVQVAVRAGEEPAVDWIVGPLAGELKDEAARAERDKLVAWSAPTPSQGMGQLVIQDTQSESPVRLNVARYHANVVLQPPVALVQIDQSFYNPYPRQEEGTFIFNLPRGASVSRFAMYVTAKDLIEGELIERGQANNIYSSIVRSKRDPAILEQIGDNLFKMRVFPIFPHDVKRILLDFTLPLEADGGVCRFDLPLLSDLAPIWDFRLQGRIQGPHRSDSVHSWSHPKLVFEQGADLVSFDLRERMHKPQADFSLSFGVPEKEEATLHAYRAPPVAKPETSANRLDPWREKEATYFLATLPPRSKPAADAEPPADVLILADTSSGTRSRELLRRNVSAVARHLGDRDRFRLAAVDASLRLLGKEWLAPRGAAAEKTLAEFDDQFLLGATNLEQGFTTAAKSFSDETKDRRRVIIYIGDGVATAGETQTVLLFDSVRKAFAESHVSYSAVDIGGNPAGRSLLENLASASGGALFDGLSPSGRLDLFRWLLAATPQVPRIESLEVSGVAADDLHYTPYLLPGRPLRIYGRSPTTSELTVKCSIIAGGKAADKEWKVAAGEKQDDVFIGRLWAQRRLEFLIRDLKRKDIKSEFPREQIVALSQEWSLLSPFTAFLVLETEADYQRWGIDRRVRRKYWRPEGKQDAVPLAAEWLKRIMVELKTSAQQETYEAAIAKAETSLRAGDYDRALGHLRDVRSLPQATTDERYARLTAQAQTAARQAPPGTSRLGHVMFSPHGMPLSLRQPGISPLLLGWSLSAENRGREFGLAREVALPEREMPIRDFAEWLADETRLPVDVDFKALDGVGVSADTPISKLGKARMTARSVARHVLYQLELVLSERDGRLIITTPEVADNRLETTIYPVGDLILAERATPRDLLLPSPLAQRSLAAERRLAEKLDRPVSFDFKETPLSKVIESIAEDLGDNVLIDERALNGVGVGLDTPVTNRITNVPAQMALGRLLRNLELDFYVKDEAIVITTPEVADNRLLTRVYSGKGLLAMYPAASLPLWQPAWGRRGGFGGMAGMGMGFGGIGGMGGGGGAMGGMGGMMGGMVMGGPGGGTARAPAGGEPAAQGVDENLISSGGEGVETLPPPVSPAAEPEPAPTPGGLSLVVSGAGGAAISPRGRRPDADSAAKGRTPHYMADFDSLIDLITTTIAPTTWEDAGGAGFIGEYRPTLDIVVSATWKEHVQIATLLDKLRKLPFEADPTTGSLPADHTKAVPKGGADSASFDGLIDLITSAIQPTTWEDAGGAGAIQDVPSRLALVLSATSDVHEDVLRLLMLLRRNKHALDHGPQNWDRIDSGRVLAGLGLTSLDRRDVQSSLPEPRGEELVALVGRREPKEGRWIWSVGHPASKSAPREEIRHFGNRLEWRQGGQTSRVEGEQAALAYSDLSLVELGGWGDAVRRELDVEFPWLPHRSNLELARLFEVVPTTGPAVKVTYVRLKPNGNNDPEGTYLLAGYREADGLPVLFESYVQGRLVSRISFASLETRNARPEWGLVKLEDATGKVLREWRLGRAEEPEQEILGLTRGWEGYQVLDLRDKSPEVDTDFHAALASIEDRDWARARRRLSLLIDERPAQPLLRLLRAWCLDHEPGTAGDLRADLTIVTKSPAVGLTRFVASGSFASLSPQAIYALLREQHPASRSLDDVERLARAALAAGQLEAARSLIRGSLARAVHKEGDDPFGELEGANKDGLESKDLSAVRCRPFVESDVRFFERFKLLVDLEARQGAGEPLQALLDRFAAEGEGSSIQFCELASVLSEHGQRKTADALLARRLENKVLVPSERTTLLGKRAALQSDDFERGKLRLELVALLPAESSQRQDATDELLAELHSAMPADQIGKLAELVSDEVLLAQLWLRQAELEERPTAAAELVWKAYLSGHLPPAKSLWACQRLAAADQPARVVRLCEAHLRGGEALAVDELGELSKAYRSLGRTADASRADQQDPVAAATAPPHQRQPPRPRGLRRGQLGWQGGF